MGTAIEWAPYISLIVIVGTIIYMYYRNKYHKKHQRERMHEFNRFMTKETGGVYKNPKVIEEEFKNFYHSQLKESQVSLEAERVTLHCGESGMLLIKHFIWESEGALCLFPTKEVLKEINVNRQEFIKLYQIPLDKIVTCKHIKTDDIIEELREQTELVYFKNEEENSLAFNVEDLVILRLMLPEKVE